MNQIPNIEEENWKNRVIDEFKEKIIFETEYEEGMRCHYQDAVNWLRAILEKNQDRHHQQLQKAREEAIAREKQLKQIHMMELDAISCMSLEQYVDWRDYRKQRPHHSELDQPNK